MPLWCQYRTLEYNLKICLSKFDVFKILFQHITWLVMIKFMRNLGISFLFSHFCSCVYIGIMKINIWNLNYRCARNIWRFHCITLGKGSSTTIWITDWLVRSRFSNKYILNLYSQVIVKYMTEMKYFVCFRDHWENKHCAKIKNYFTIQEIFFCNQVITFRKKVVTLEQWMS